MPSSLVERPTNITFPSNHFNMINVSFDLQMQQELEDCQYILDQLEQEWPLREQVSRALKRANAAFATQYTEPDGCAFMQTCDDLLDLLDLKVELEYTQQELVVSVLQVACAMHDSAVNNSSLTSAQLSTHYLATTSLVPLCKSALEHVTYPDLRRSIATLVARAEEALAKATKALDISRFLGHNDDYLPQSEEGQIVQGPSPTVMGPVPSGEYAPGSPPYDCLDPVTSKLKHKALAMMRDQSHKVSRPVPSTAQSSKTAPLGRRHTMPTLSHTTSKPYPPRKTVGLTASRSRSRRHELHALQETEE